MTLFNAAGQQMATLVNETQESGNHHVCFDGTRLASGVYFCRLTEGTLIRTKTMLLLRFQRCLFSETALHSA